jgi:hypothetical protein
MRGLVRRPQSGGRDVRVHLGGAQAGVAQQLLDHAQVGATIEEMARERVAERVG